MFESMASLIIPASCIIPNPEEPSETTWVFLASFFTFILFTIRKLTGEK
jgi:hypothetical protein